MCSFATHTKKNSIHTPCGTPVENVWVYEENINHFCYINMLFFSKVKHFRAIQISDYYIKFPTRLMHSFA